MRDLKYLLAYLLPLSAVLALGMHGVWSWSALLLAFGILPVLDVWTPGSTANIPEQAEDSRSRRIFFDLLLYANAPLLFGIVAVYLMAVQHLPLSTVELIGLSFSVGIVVGANGINVAHEIGHRSERADHLISQAMLLPALYQHFFIEHNRGHHKNVATPDDPATARLGETVYVFWIRSIGLGWLNAWRLERERLSKTGMSFWTLQNLMLRFQLVQLIYLAAVGIFIGTQALVGALAIALIGVLLLETVNYIEHYGLLRGRLPSGRPEPVRPVHSWNSNHEMGRIFLFELTRHSDHHFKATRKYQILRHLDESPQLPYGYPTCIMIALAPPVWFSMMNSRVQLARVGAGYGSAV